MSTSNQRFSDSTNPVSDANSISPEFVNSLPTSHKNIVSSILINNNLSIHDKIESIDLFSKDMPNEARFEYRKWRFSVDRSRLPEFINYQNEHLKKLIRDAYEKYPDLEEFAQLMISMKGAFQNPGAFEQWLKEECITMNEEAQKQSEE
ncbi:hypothetical protein WR25_25399 [Diploscapter pachys]|uniref:Uncharacterized protein n=1 Tax=Diploscapter pachys TaxID=2018661 RepID=A0A2A2JRX9_9BILA|nr:hypothetical protein WR25_25399 [Diploscapter pachys]